MTAVAVALKRDTPVLTELEQDPSVKDHIRMRAYEIWLQRGAQDGSDLEDWLQAEEEVLLQTPTRE
jgi:hypothetical protein